MEFSIGRLAKLAGVPIRTVRFYSEIGLVPESGRTEAGYRKYDETSLARLELVITLRELGLSIPTARRIAERQVTVEEVATTQAGATEAHIRQLRLRLGVLRAITGGISSPEEVRRMTEFAHASAEEARRVMDEFVDAVFAEHEDNPFAERMRAALPALPDNPTDGQVDAWIELASLVRDASFRERVRQMVVEGERQRNATGLSDTDAATQAAGQAVLDKAGAAVASGIDPGAAAAAPIVDALVALFAGAAGRTDDAAYRAELRTQLETFSDTRVERYWQLIAAINGWPQQASMTPAYEWLIAALDANGAGTRAPAPR